MSREGSSTVSGSKVLLRYFPFSYLSACAWPPAHSLFPMSEESFAEADLSGPLADTSHLAKQDLATLDVSKLHALSPEVMSRQATINIGTIGHVAHGKSTLVKAISGVQTVRFRKELERNITIKLGYANAKLYKCAVPRCMRALTVAGARTPRARARSATRLTGAATRTAPRSALTRSSRPCPPHDLVHA